MRKIKFGEKENRKKEDDVFTARAIIPIGDRFLVQSFLEKHGTYITLGGHVMKGESIWEGLKRELSEEAGIEIKIEPKNPEFVFMRNHYFILRPEGIEIKGHGSDTDGGKVALVTREQFEKTNADSLAVPVIHSDDVAFKQLIGR